MDIKHLEYFVEIVKCNCNLSVAARKINISQPALSSIIKNFEIQSNVQLFKRQKNRLIGLTTAGEVFYKNSLELIEGYINMISEMQANTPKYKGEVSIGIPPLVLSVIFSDILPKIILNNSDIKFTIVEQGAYELRKQLLSKDLDFAMLLHPTDISQSINEYAFNNSELTAFMCSKNPLANNEYLNWADLEEKSMAIFNSTFLIHHQLLEKFKLYNLRPKIVFMSSCWDLLLLSVKNTEIITVLPSPVADLFNIPDIVQIPFTDPIPWQMRICQLKKKSYNHLEKHVLKEILDAWQAKQKENRKIEK
ncbi:MAG: LysR family transcriptional regulator [Defluviitaleaceae bacterium]|nr:LysR family transcriptional regulator [Defluviitaleaceae bacterium]